MATALHQLQHAAHDAAMLLYDRESPLKQPTETFNCTLGASRGTTYKVVISIAELVSPTKLRPCNNGSCQNRDCKAFANWSLDDIKEHFQ